MTMHNRNPRRAYRPMTDSSASRSHRPSPEDTYVHYHRVPEELSEVNGLRAQVDYLTRREKEALTNVKSLRSRQLVMQHEQVVLEKKVQFEQNRVRVAEAKYALLKAEVAAADSARELSESKSMLERVKPM